MEEEVDYQEEKVWVWAEVGESDEVKEKKRTKKKKEGRRKMKKEEEEEE